MLQRLFNIAESKVVFFFEQGKSVLSTVQFTVTIFSVSSFHETFEASKKKKIADLLSLYHHRAPSNVWWTIHGTVHSLTDWQYFTKFSISYLNANFSRPVFRFSL